MTSTSAPVRRQLRPSGRLLPEDTRRHHRALLLQLLFRYGPASRADLARSSGLTRVTVSDVVGTLVAEGLLAESAAPVQGRVGKPPVLVHLAEGSRQIVAVDLSADGVATGALLNLSGGVQQRRTRPLEGRRGQTAVDLTGDDPEPHLAVRLRQVETDIERNDLIEDAVLTLAPPDDAALVPVSSG